MVEHINKGQAALKLWQEHEWIDIWETDGIGQRIVEFCPVCRSMKEQGHAAECELGKLLNRPRGSIADTLLAALQAALRIGKIRPAPPSPRH